MTSHLDHNWVVIHYPVCLSNIDKTISWAQELIIHSRYQWNGRLTDRWWWWCVVCPFQAFLLLVALNLWICCAQGRDRFATRIGINLVTDVAGWLAIHPSIQLAALRRWCLGTWPLLTFSINWRWLINCWKLFTRVVFVWLQSVRFPFSLAVAFIWIEGGRLLLTFCRWLFKFPFLLLVDKNKKGVKLKLVFATWWHCWDLAGTLSSLIKCCSERSNYSQ